jgi:hypothetical protein
VQKCRCIGKVNSFIFFAGCSKCILGVISFEF